MPETPRYLIGGGERLSTEIPRAPGGFGDKAHPYSFAHAKKRLAPQAAAVSQALRSLPTAALPANEAVVGLTLHPSYLAKSYYPSNLLKTLGLRHMGSRAVHIRPERLVTQKSLDDPRPLLAPLIYVAGNVDGICSFAESVLSWDPRDEKLEEDFRKVETFAIPGEDRLKPLPETFKAKAEIPVEIVLHNDEAGNYAILPGFREYARSLGVKFIDGGFRQVGGLAFLAARAPTSSLSSLLDFTFVRALRAMPGLKPLDPILRSGASSFPVSLPILPAIAPELAVAIFDGGLPANHGLEQWVTLHEPAGIGAPLAGGQSHGLGVTSAFLFGPLEMGTPPSAPPANVDHWRVIGDDMQTDDFALLPILNRIENVLSSRHYDFINISLGPDISIEDDDVNAWTSTIDVLLADGETVATVACGNNGMRDRLAGLHRVQPPSDGVNVISVGAADRLDSAWSRAPYSACGPGRSPGFVKPDLIAFGGSPASPFLMLQAGSTVAGDCGTSFAAPLVLRCAAGARAHFTEHLWAPTVKALLIHNAEAGLHGRDEVGWGCLPHGLGDIVLCGDGEAHVVYQRQMPLQGSIRMELPVPLDVSGRVKLKATFCIYSDVDPEDALNYTRAGLEIAFRPDSVTLPPPYIDKKSGKLIHPTLPKTASFFSSEDLYASEFARRDDAYKWETAFTKTKQMNSTSLLRPVFDVSYSSRSHGQTGTRSPHLKIGLVLTIAHSGTKDMYERVVKTAAGRLQPMRARAGVTVPARVRVG